MTLSSDALLHMRPGRKRLVIVGRSPDGRSNGERPDAIVKTARTYRVRHGAPEHDALNERYGSTIGILRMRGAISDKQFWTAERYRDNVVANAKIMGIPSPHPRALDLNGVGGIGCERDKDPDVVLEIRRTFSDARRALIDCGCGFGLGLRINGLVYGVVIEDRSAAAISQDDIKNLRCGLNALGKVFK